MLHYAPIRATVEGEPPEIFAFLGSSRLEEPLNRYENHLLNTARQGVDIIERIGADNIFMHLDTYHMNIEEKGAANTDTPSWASVTVPLTPWAGQTVRIVFVAADRTSSSTVEAAVDDVRVTRP